MALPPTDRQIALALKLGIALSGTETFDDLSAMLGRATFVAPDEETLQLAKTFGIGRAETKSRSELLAMIALSVDVRGREFDLACWYAFRVARHLGIAVASPSDQRIVDIADRLLDIPGMVLSISRQARKSPLDVFGSGMDANTNSACYRETRKALLSAGFEVPS